jgi:hypothetical protein
LVGIGRRWSAKMGPGTLWVPLTLACWSALLRFSTCLLLSAPFIRGRQPGDRLGSRASPAATVFLVARGVLGLLFTPSMIAASVLVCNSGNRASLRGEGVGDWRFVGPACRAGLHRVPSGRRDLPASGRPACKDGGHTREDRSLATAGGAIAATHCSPPWRPAGGRYIGAAGLATGKGVEGEPEGARNPGRRPPCQVICLPAGEAENDAGNCRKMALACCGAI